MIELLGLMGQSGHSTFLLGMIAFMSLGLFLFVEPFDFYGTAIANITSYIATGTPGTSFSLVAGRISPSRAMRVLPVGSGVAMTFPFAAQQTAVIGYAFQLAQSGFANGSVKWPLFAIGDGGVIHLTMGIDPSGRLFIFRGSTAGTLLFTTTNTILANVWYQMEFKFKIDDVTGTIEMRINGSSVGWIPPQTGLDTRNVGTATADRIIFTSGVSVSAANYDIDDLYVLETTTAPHNDFLGDCKLVTNFPSANGVSNQWTPNGDAQNFQAAAHNPPVDGTNFCSDNVVGHRQLFTFPAVSGTVLAAALVTREFKSDAGTRETSDVVISGGNPFVQTSLALGTTPLHKARIFETDPNTAAAWVLGNFNGASWGKDVSL